MKKKEKTVTIQKELDGLDNIENLKDLPRLMFIDEECGNLKVFNDRTECTGNINQKSSQLF